VLKLSYTFASLDPTLSVLVPPLISQLIQSRPVNGMIISEFHITTYGFHQVAGWHMLPKIFVELQLLPSQWVDKRSD
jgi:hypothetical protein